MGANSGVRIVNRRSEPPASINSTLADDSAANRPAVAQPAEPAPTTMKSKPLMVFVMQRTIRPPRRVSIGQYA
jgi:hypothetical protein